jgi:predicted flap endonuclease-1-like 5' DNA nuclease
MYYLISQILLSLLFTAALGVIAGWLLRGASVRAQLAAAERERERERERTRVLEERIAAAEAKATRSDAPVRAMDPQPRRDADAIAALRERLAQLDSVARSQAERITELGQRLREKDALLERLKPATERPAPPRGRGPVRTRPPSAPPAELLAQRPQDTDRLQAIAGIGPVLERVLNELGIYRFSQLAQLTPDNIEWLASRIDWFPQRIQREDWVGQARRLQREQHPDEELGGSDRQLRDAPPRRG